MSLQSPVLRSPNPTAAQFEGRDEEDWEEEEGEGEGDGEVVLTPPGMQAGVASVLGALENVTISEHNASIINNSTISPEQIKHQRYNDEVKQSLTLQRTMSNYFVMDKEAKGNKQLNVDIENLIFRGGGMKGIAYCGALDVVASLGMLNNVKRVAGTSAGSMFATLLAIGYSSAEIEHIFRTTNFKAFKDGKKGVWAKMDNLYLLRYHSGHFQIGFEFVVTFRQAKTFEILLLYDSRYRKFGMFEGKVFYEWFGRRIAYKTNNPDTTFGELFNMTQKELVVVGTCLSHCEVHYFSHHTSPNMKIRDAVRISMSIPLFFEPVIDGDHFFVDGCVLDNFPLWVFDSSAGEFDPEAARYAPVNMKTLGLYIVEDSEVDPEVVKIDGLKGYIGCMLNAFMNRISQLAFKPGDDERMMHIRARHIQAANFGLCDSEKDLLFHEGQLAARRFYGVTQQHLGDEFVKVNQLIVKLKSASNMRTGYWNRDVYVVLSMGSETKKSSVKRSNNPTWDDIFVFKVQDDHVLKIEVCSHKSLRTDRCVASHEIKMSELETEVKKEISLPVEDHGKLNLQLILSPPI